MVTIAITFFAIFIILYHAENVNTRLTKKSRICVGNIITDFDWDEKLLYNRALGKRIAKHVLLNRRYSMMITPESKEYFEYLKKQLFLISDIDHPVKYCINKTNNVAKDQQKEFFDQCHADMFAVFLKVDRNVVKETISTQLSLQSGQPLLILSENVIEIAKDIFSNLIKSDFNGMNIANQSQFYYNSMINIINFQDEDNIKTPQDFCIEKCDLAKSSPEKKRKLDKGEPNPSSSGMKKASSSKQT